MNDAFVSLSVSNASFIALAFHSDTGLAPVLDISGRVSSAANERGLLGIVPAPAFVQTSLVYLAYTRLTDNALTLSRIPLTDATREEVLLTQAHAQFGNHNGGQLAFGPDGFLYWSLGDGGGADLAAGIYVATDYCSSTAWAVLENPDGTHTNARIGQFPRRPRRSALTPPASSTFAGVGQDR